MINISKNDNTIAIILLQFLLLLLYASPTPPLPKLKSYIILNKKTDSAWIKYTGCGNVEPIGR